ncbi:hypothetical protein EVJ58_g4427 [Rhodofomes roseus]|uniref:Fungal-type protein kinase domain-containing protein n=1 Tax=Rhodofomes roseus TaxID=34475 RepID=A0A4Y9YIQ0_9APHY|nr:hypothetical protein EVJ58_g4427 [Rhodofomes roseus]
MAQPIFDNCPEGERLVAKHTGNFRDNTDDEDPSGYLKVDVSVYPAHEDAVNDCTDPDDDDSDSYTDNTDWGAYEEDIPVLDTPEARTRWAWISLAIIVKMRHKASPFEFMNDMTESFLRYNPRGNGKADRSLGYLAECVSKVFRRQHRLHCFTIYVCKGKARVVRWDRAGAVVSTPIDFVEDPRPLQMVFWRYACMTQVQRGFDPTVSLATKAEIDAMRACQAPNEWADKCRQDALSQPGWPVYKAKMPAESFVDQRDFRPLLDGMIIKTRNTIDDRMPTGEEPCFLVGKPFHASEWPVGRGYRSYVTSGPLGRQEIGCPLELHQSAEFLASYLYEAIDAHRQAWELVRILHRDINPRNILIYDVDTPGGCMTISILDGWDVCQTEEFNNAVTASRPGRAGTWQFMSARLLTEPAKKHEVEDDLESFVYVLWWICHRFYTPYDFAAGLLGHLEMRYDGGGISKSRAMSQGIIDPIGYCDGTPLSRLLKQLASICRDHYAYVEHREKVDEGNVEYDYSPAIHFHFSSGLLPPRLEGSSCSSPPSAFQKPEPVPYPWLADHAAMLDVVAGALSAPAHRWAVVFKTADHLFNVDPTRESEWGYWEGEPDYECVDSSQSSNSDGLAGGKYVDSEDEQPRYCKDFLPVDERTGFYAPRQEHYRLVVKEIGEPLEEHESPYELVKTIWHALYGHRQAWELKELLHRDISAGNILIFRYIDKNGGKQSIGILIDWDLCKDKKYLETVLRPSRAGTWQFMSARLLSDSGKRHEVADDLESSIHVLHWILFRFIEHRLTRRTNLLFSRMLGLYDEKDDEDEDDRSVDFGGATKRTALPSGILIVELNDRNTPLGRLLQRLATLCQQQYHAVDSDSESSSALTGDRPVAHEALPKLTNPFEEDDVSHATPATPKVQASATLRSTRWFPKLSMKLSASRRSSGRKLSARQIGSRRLRSRIPPLLSAVQRAPASGRPARSGLSIRLTRSDLGPKRARSTKTDPDFQSLQEIREKS